MDDDTQMTEENAVFETTSGEFVPPSIDEHVLLSGASYSHYSPVPSCLLAPTASVTNDTTDGDASGGPLAEAVPCVLGVDEAGRGPVLGPMVYGVFYAPVDLADALLRGEAPDADRDAVTGAPHRFDDSKVLSAAVRSTLMATVCRSGSKLHSNCGWAVELLSARDIGAGMMSPTAAAGNLNAQAAESTVGLIRGVLARGVRVTDVYVDTVGPPASYQKKLERYFPGLRITVSKKADSIYPCVSAASVCAKVTRDVALEVLYKRYADALATTEGAAGAAGAATTPSWGSGYPSDARCTAWLRRNMHPLFGWGPECRFSWSTAKDMLEDSKKNGGVQVDWPEPDEDTPDNEFAVTRMTDFFTASAAAKNADDEDVVDELGSWFGQPVGTEVF
ncbi:ribonuclease H2 subunit A [Sporothrix schenckii 1099-18]|nr:ribonuclease H2 subunit A [Sporothrix schenckii 1099-18]KJR85378.1 ribonuclease H2 subunit A [Sporothrix schenckii 1099-18]